MSGEFATDLEPMRPRDTSSLWLVYMVERLVPWAGS